MGRIKEIANEVRAWLKKHDWDFDEKMTDDEDAILFLTHMAAADGVMFKGYKVTIVCRERHALAVFVPPVNVDQKFYASVSEYFGRINSDYLVGKWVLDYEDGTPRWEYVKEVESLKAGEEYFMDDLIGFSGTMCDKYAEGIVKIVLGVVGTESADVEEDYDSELAPAEKNCRNVKPKGKTKTAKSRPVDAFAKNIPQGYSLDGLNVEGKIPLEDIVKAAKMFRQKKCEVETAFARHLAQEVGMPLRTVRASDILSCHVGATERLIAEVFAEAGKKGEILFLDEIDSLLLDRRNAVRSWEMSQTSTLLQEMESFTGVLLGATNLVVNLDPAALRRFKYKLRLSYLTDAGKRIFFKRYFNTPLTEDHQRRLDAIDRLTPGDFRTVKEELYYLSDKQDNESRIDALAAESAAKGQPRTKIGF